jgi:hypothetical protein
MDRINNMSRQTTINEIDIGILGLLDRDDLNFIIEEIR